MIDLLTQFDLNILLFIQDNLRADGLTWFLKIIASAGSILLSVVAVAFVFYRKLPKCYGMIALVIAALVGFSRVYLGVHYLSDVVAGAFVGCVAAVIAEKIVCRFVRI